MCVYVYIHMYMHVNIYIFLYDICPHCDLFDLNTSFYWHRIY